MLTSILWCTTAMKVVSMGEAANKVLILDADPARAALLGQRLRFLNYEPVTPGASDTGDGIAVLLGDTRDDEVLSATLQTIVKERPELPFLLVGDADVGDEMSAERPAWRVDLPIRRSQMTELLRRAERYAGVERRQRITGNSRSIREVRELIEQVAGFETNVLITGDSGTGKEIVARTIHELSDRADKPFVPINCGAIPAELLESELFGHEKGAFTGAINQRIGRFELAEGGTLFLDEIGDMSFPMQVKLLRVLQERCFERVGSNESRRSNVRIVAATHRDLPDAVDAGEFREDLFYRLNVFPIQMPPLRKRATDLPALLDELLLQHQGDGELRVSPAALQALAAYSWPGNIRELSNLVERLAILKPTGIIEFDELPAKYREQSPPTVAETPCEMTALTNANLKAHLKGVERELIEQAMLAADGVVAQAARLLKLQRTTLVEKLAKYDLH